MPRGQMSEEGRKNLALAQKRRWRKWRAAQHVSTRPRRAEPLPVVNTPSTNGLRAELNVTLHIQGNTIPLAEDEAKQLYDALGIVLHRHGLSTT